MWSAHPDEGDLVLSESALLVGEDEHAVLALALEGSRAFIPPLCKILEEVVVSRITVMFLPDKLRNEISCINFRKTSQATCCASGKLHAQLPAGLRSWIGYTTTLSNGLQLRILRVASQSGFSRSPPRHPSNHQHYPRTDARVMPYIIGRLTSFSSFFFAPFYILLSDCHRLQQMPGSHWQQVPRTTILTPSPLAL